jgi:hypothetical protein
LKVCLHNEAEWLHCLAHIFHGEAKHWLVVVSHKAVTAVGIAYGAIYLMAELCLECALNHLFHELIGNESEGLFGVNKTGKLLN